MFSHNGLCGASCAFLSGESVHSRNYYINSNQIFIQILLNDKDQQVDIVGPFSPSVTTVNYGKYVLIRSRLRFRLGWWVGFVQGTTYLLGVHVDATWQIRLNDCAQPAMSGFASDTACFQISLGNVVNSCCLSVYRHAVHGVHSTPEDDGHQNEDGLGARRGARSGS